MGTGGFTAVTIENGVVVGRNGTGFALWQGGVRTDLPAPPGTRVSSVGDVAVVGGTVHLVGAVDTTPTVWRCS